MNREKKMIRIPSPLYRKFPANSSAMLKKSIERGLNTCQSDSAEIFFRADDIGVMSDSFIRLIKLFELHRIPLNLAVVPAWISEARWSAISNACDVSSALWCWHQHGWRHRNHQAEGKKGEFGSQRKDYEIKADILKGMERLQTLLGSNFSPFFTPPWNRCSEQTLTILESSGFRAVSRDSGAKPASLLLPDFPVNTDLHTRREKNPDDSLKNLASEFESGIRSGRLGIMIHHQRMNESAFTLLDELLQMVAGNDVLIPVTFKDLSTGTIS